jgi:hypothetical protein
VCFHIQLIVFCQWGEIHREPQFIDDVHVVGIEEGRICLAAAHHGLAVVFAAGNLRVEAGVELFGQGGVAAYVERDFILVAEPVEVAPDFAAVHFFGAGVGRHAAHGFEYREADRDVSGLSAGLCV